jgi:hypothetical protein
MALEAESLEHTDTPTGVFASPTVHAPNARDRARAHRRWLVGTSLALAAGIALTIAGVFVLTPSTPAPQPIAHADPIKPASTTPTPAAPTPHTKETPLATAQSGPTNIRVASREAGPDQNVLVVIAHSPETGAHCVQWGKCESWNTRCLSDISEAQLRSVRLRGDCEEPRPQITRIALAGPAGSLPIGDAKAAQLADCILRSDRPCDGSGACYLSAASKCLPPNVSVRIETVPDER